MTTALLLLFVGVPLLAACLTGAVTLLGLLKEPGQHRAEQARLAAYRKAGHAPLDPSMERLRGTGDLPAVMADLPATPPDGDGAERPGQPGKNEGQGAGLAGRHESSCPSSPPVAELLAPLPAPPADPGPDRPGQLIAEHTTPTGQRAGPVLPGWVRDILGDDTVTGTLRRICADAGMRA